LDVLPIFRWVVRRIALRSLEAEHKRRDAWRERERNAAVFSKLFEGIEKVTTRNTTLELR